MESSGYLENDRRKNLRIVYQDAEKPILKIGKETFPVSDINEKGMGIDAPLQPLAPDGKIMGLVVFKNGETLGVEGTLIWTENNRTGIEFINPLSIKVIIREHTHRTDMLKDKP